MKQMAGGSDDCGSTGKSADRSDSKSAAQSAGDVFNLKNLKKEYEPFGIYLFKCNKSDCETGLHALHLDECLN